MSEITVFKKKEVTFDYFEQKRVENELKMALLYGHELAFFKPSKKYPDNGIYYSPDKEKIIFGVGYSLKDRTNCIRIICLNSDYPQNLYLQSLVVADLFESYTPSNEQILEVLKGIKKNASQEGHRKDRLLRVYSWVTHMMEKFGIKNEEEENRLQAISVNITDQERKALAKEMITKVDMKQFLSVLAVAMHNDEEDVKKKFPTREMALEILEKWAFEKAPIYKFFGNKLLLEEDCMIEKTYTDMKEIADTLTERFPEIAFFMEVCGQENFLENKIMYQPYEDQHKFWEKMGVPSGSKVTKVVAQIFKNNSLDEAVSRIFQDKKVNATFKVSIDPYDYLTMSMNKHGWQSCHRINYGEYTTGPFSYLCDPSSVVGYRTNRKTYQYNEMEFKFEGNSKAWRTNILFDPNTTSFMVGRQYPHMNSNFGQKITDILLTQIYEKTGIKNIDLVSSEENPEFGFSKFILDDFPEMHYNDFINSDYDIEFFYPTSTTKMPFFNVGSQVYCPICKKEIDDSNMRIAHFDCVNDGEERKEPPKNENVWTMPPWLEAELTQRPEDEVVTG